MLENMQFLRHSCRQAGEVTCGFYCILFNYNNFPVVQAFVWQADPSPLDFGFLLFIAWPERGNVELSPCHESELRATNSPLS